MKAVADYTRQNSSAFSYGPRPLTPAQESRRRQNIEALADKLDELADEARSGKASYAQFENLLNKLNDLGFFPQLSLVSAVAQAM